MMYNITRDHDGSSTVFIVYADGSSAVIPNTHQTFDQLVEALVAGADEEAIHELADIRIKLAKTFLPLSERVSMRNDKLYFDGDRIKGILAKRIIAAVGSSDQTAPSLVQFLEKVAQNPDQESRDEIYRWLESRHFTLTPNGDIIAYKGLTIDHTSVQSGIALVDGVRHVGQIPNYIATTVSMPRASVDDDRTIGCSTGLHVGTYEFAQGFHHAGVVVKVRINPRDVVSVPSDSGYQKMRVCRYYVLEQVSGPELANVVHGHVPVRIDTDSTDLLGDEIDESNQYASN